MNLNLKKLTEIRIQIYLKNSNFTKPLKFKIKISAKIIYLPVLGVNRRLSILSTDNGLTSTSSG